MPPSLSWRQWRESAAEDITDELCLLPVVKVYCYRVAGTVGIMTLPVCLAFFETVPSSFPWKSSLSAASSGTPDLLSSSGVRVGLAAKARLRSHAELYGGVAGKQFSGSNHLLFMMTGCMATITAVMTLDRVLTELGHL